MWGLALPADCTGKTVLDVGGYDGRMAAECLERGSDHAICVDSGQWKHYGWGPPAIVPGVFFKNDDVHNWKRPTDIVICWNVIYHQQDPWTFAAHLRTITREVLVLCSSFVESDPGGRPMWIVYVPGEGHPVSRTVVWRPTPEGLIKLLEAVGFSRVEEVSREGDHIAVRAYP